MTKKNTKSFNIVHFTTLCAEVGLGISNSSPLYRRWVKAVDIQNKKEYYARIEYFSGLSKEIKERELDQSIFLLFKKHYAAHLVANTLEKLQGENTPSIKLDEVESLFTDSPSNIELQNDLILLLNRVFRIETEILFTIDDLIVSTGYRQSPLESALQYLSKIDVIEKRGS